MSGCEVAFFSLDKSHRDQLEKENSPSSLKVLKLLDSPKQLLATILIANNFVNVGVVIVSSFLLNKIIDHSEISPGLLFFIEVVLITFIILLLGEVMPKVYATKYNMTFSKTMSSALSMISRILSPFSSLLVSSTSIIDKRVKRRASNISVDELELALDLTKEDATSEDEKKILEGIIKFGNTDAKQVMQPRMDVVALEMTLTFQELKDSIVDAKYSRIPIFKESLDNIEGILYIKDILRHIDDGTFEDWQALIRQSKFIPENKKLGDLLKEFQEEKKHIAIVVDEYGGTSGIVSLEDVLEEIVGDITDEFDDDDLIYSKLDELNYVFEGKTPLMDMYRIMGIEGEPFEESKGESDTIAGFCIEQAGKILMKNEKVNFNEYTFVIESSDRRRIKQVKVTINEG